MKIIKLQFFLILFSACDEPTFVQEKKHVSKLPEEFEVTNVDFTTSERFDLSILKKIKSLEKLNVFLIKNYDQLFDLSLKNRQDIVTYPTRECDSLQYKNSIVLYDRRTNYSDPIPNNLIKYLNILTSKVDTMTFYSYSFRDNKEILYCIKEIEVNDKAILIHSLIFNCKTQLDCLCKFNKDTLLQNGLTYRIAQMQNYYSIGRKMNKK